jgi:hypothetical protein
MNRDDPVYQVVGVGSNGFPGFSPDFSEKYERDSYAVYGDIARTSMTTFTYKLQFDTKTILTSVMSL